nr:uncharacterized protein LOC105872292 [Microcebus murinus]
MGFEGAGLIVGGGQHRWQRTGSASGADGPGGPWTRVAGSSSNKDTKISDDRQQQKPRMPSEMGISDQQAMLFGPCEARVTAHEEAEAQRRRPPARITRAGVLAEAGTLGRAPVTWALRHPCSLPGWQFREQRAIVAAAWHFPLPQPSPVGESPCGSPGAEGWHSQERAGEWGAQSSQPRGRGRPEAEGGGGQWTAELPWPCGFLPHGPLSASRASLTPQVCPVPRGGAWSPPSPHLCALGEALALLWA